jgi:hypothetical protein
MSDLINTLLECPNLSLRLLDSASGRSIKTINQQQLQQLFEQQGHCSSKDCGNMSCQHRAFED